MHQKNKILFQLTKQHVDFDIENKMFLLNTFIPTGIRATHTLFQFILDQTENFTRISFQF